MTTTDECRAAARELVGQTLQSVRYIGLTYESASSIEWDFGTWHHPEVGVELGTTSGRQFFAIWDHKVTNHELTLAEGSISTEWIPSQHGTERSWDVTLHPRWAPLLRSPLTTVEVIERSVFDDNVVLAPLAVRLTNELAAAWLVAAGPTVPSVRPEPIGARTLFLGHDEVVVLFDERDAVTLGLHPS